MYIDLVNKILQMFQKPNISIEMVQIIKLAPILIRSFLSLCVAIFAHKLCDS